MTDVSGRNSAGWIFVFVRHGLRKFVAAYVLLLGVLALLGRWTPDYLAGRDLWHFTISRMVVALVMLGVIASFMRLIPAAVLLAASLLAIGTISAIKRDATGEPFQVSDLFLLNQTPVLFGYVGWTDWLTGAAILPALYFGLRNLRLRLWSVPLAACCVALLATYRLEAVVTWIHANSYWIGVENLTFSQAESERMNGLATHLYFSTAGLRLTTYSDDEVKAELARLDPAPVAAGRTKPAPDIFIVLGEAWWRNPADPDSPIDKLVAAGFSEGTLISPVYGGTTPNAEFELLTAVPVRSFMSGIIPYQHYVDYFSDNAKTLPRLLASAGYTSRAYHNFERQYWLRDRIYPRFGFASYDSMETMTLTEGNKRWPGDEGLFAKVGTRLEDAALQFHYIITVQTHGPYAEDKTRDMIGGERHPGITDYRNRLSGAVESLVAFEAKLRARGRPYVIFAFGDHLPGIRLHQWKMGWKSPDDPRLFQVPFLAISNSEDAEALRRRLDMRPLTCVAPVLTDWLRLGLEDLYHRHMTRLCDANVARSFVPGEPVIQHQLFSSRAD